MSKEIIWEAVKEPLRLLALGLISLTVVYVSGLTQEWAGVLLLVLRGVDKLLHELGKEQKNDSLIRGLTRF